MIEFRPAVPDDVAELYPRLRACDLREATAVAGRGLVQEAIRRSVERATSARAALVNGEVHALFGVAPGWTPGGGVIWFLGSNEVDRNARAMLLDGRDFVSRSLAQYASLYNFVHHENTPSIRWLRFLGFTVEDAITPVGIDGEPFHFFHQSRHVS